MRTVYVLLTKAYVRGHHRQLPDGRRVYIAPYFTRHRATDAAAAPAQRRPLTHDVPVTTREPLTAAQLSTLLVRQVREGRLTAAEADANLAHLATRAQAGHGLAHGHGPAWSADEVHGFVQHAQAALQAHHAERAAQHEAKQRATLQQVEGLIETLEEQTSHLDADTHTMQADEEHGAEPEPQEVMLVTGRTYPHRQELRRLGAVWHESEKGYIVPSQHEAAVRDYATRQGLTLDRVDVDADAFEPVQGEALRASRQRGLDKKITAWRAQADRLEAQRRAIDAKLHPYNDMAFWTEPIKVGHHSEQRHRNLRARLSALMDKQYVLGRDAAALREKADRLEQQGARVKGDADARRQRARTLRDVAGVTVGSRIFDAIYGLGTVRKVNKNSYTVLFDSGHTTATDKSHVRPTGEHVSPEELKAKTTPKLQRGQRVMYNYIGRDRDGVISHVGPQRYTITTPEGFKYRIDHARVWVHPDAVVTKAATLCLLVRKAHVPGHYRTLPDGRRIYVEPYFTKVVPKHAEGTQRRRHKEETPAPHGRTPITPEGLARRLVEHVAAGRMRHADALGQLEYYAQRAGAGHGMTHGGDHVFTPTEVLAFTHHAQAYLTAHQDAKHAQAEAQREAAEAEARAREAATRKTAQHAKRAARKQAKDAPTRETPPPDTWAEKPQPLETRFHTEAFAEAPAYLRKAIAQITPLSNVLIGVAPQKRSTCYLYAQNAIVFADKHRANLFPGEDGMAVWRHEYGHHMDKVLQDATAETDRPPGLYASAAFVSALKQDTKGLLAAWKDDDAHRARRDARVQALTERFTQRPAEIDTVLQEHGFDPEETKAVLANRPLWTGAALEATIANFVVATELRDVNQVLSVLPWIRSCWNFQDLIGSVTKKRIKLPAGHSAAYYRKGTRLDGGWTTLHTTECFANWVDAEGHAGSFWRQLYTAFAPATTAAFRERVQTWQRANAPSAPTRSAS
jgi:hypothetical protein